MALKLSMVVGTDANIDTTIETELDALLTVSAAAGRSNFFEVIDIKLTTTVLAGVNQHNALIMYRDS